MAPSPEAPTWLLLRGLCRGSFHWGEFPTQLAAAQPGARVLVPDLPGNGERWRETSPTSVPAMVAAYRQSLLLSQSSLSSSPMTAPPMTATPIRQPLRLIALSMGGMVGLQWLQDYPDEIAQLVLVNSSAANLVPLYRRLTPAAALGLLQGNLRGHKARERAVLDFSSERSAHRQLLQGWVDYAAAHPVSWANCLRQLWAAARFRCPQLAPALAARVLVMNSAQDRLVAPVGSRRLAEFLDCPLIVHPSAGHDLPLDDSAWLIRQLAL